MWQSDRHFSAFKMQRYGKVFIYPQNCRIFFVSPSLKAKRTAWKRQLAALKEKAERNLICMAELSDFSDVNTWWKSARATI